MILLFDIEALLWLSQRTISLDGHLYQYLPFCASIKTASSLSLFHLAISRLKSSCSMIWTAFSNHKKTFHISITFVFFDVVLNQLHESHVLFWPHFVDKLIRDLILDSASFFDRIFEYVVKNVSLKNIRNKHLMTWRKNKLNRTFTIIRRNSNPICLFKNLKRDEEALQNLSTHLLRVEAFQNLSNHRLRVGYNRSWSNM